MQSAISETLIEHDAYTPELSAALMDYMWMMFCAELTRGKLATETSKANWRHMKDPHIESHTT
jgi:hypothetical protein